MTSISLARVAIITLCVVALHLSSALGATKKLPAEEHIVDMEIPDVFSGPPKLTLEEMKYRVDIPSAMGGGTVLKPLPLAPKVGVRFRFDPATREESNWNLTFAENHSAKILSGPQELPSQVHLFLELPEQEQEKILDRLNILLADPNVLDILPVFYVDNREVIVIGVQLEFPVSFGKRQLLQMLYAYGEVTDLVVEQVNKSGRWSITPKEERLFTLPARIVKRDGVRTFERRFDLNLLLLANLFENERIAKEVSVRRARPIFKFLEPPLVASLAVHWGSASIGNPRELRLTVTVFDEEHVIFDPKRIPELGTERLTPRRAKGEKNPVRSGWLKFVDPSGMPSKKGFGWKGGGRSVQTIAGRSVAVYEFTQSFYILEPEESWEIDSLIIPYQLKRADAPKPVEVTAEAPGVTFHVFAHSAKEGDITMPPPPPYMLPGEADVFVNPPPHRPNRNQTPMYLLRMSSAGESLRL